MLPRKRRDRYMRAVSWGTHVTRLRRGVRQSRPDRACVVGDGEAETGPLATSWHSNKFLNPATDGAVLPILHLNGYKIANPQVLARISHEELEQLFRGYGYTPYFVEGDDPETMHRLMAETLDTVIEEIRASRPRPAARPRTPPLADDRASQPQGLDLPQGSRWQEDRGLLALAPGADGRDARQPGPCANPGGWMKSYRPTSYSMTPAPAEELAELAPQGQ